MKNQIRLSLVLLFGLALLQSCSNTIEGDLIITNVNIIDVKSGDIDSNMDLIVNGEKITSIVEHKSNANYKAENVIDGSDKFLIPGLWDMHTHTWWGYEELFPLLLANGVTGIQEMFGDLIAVKNIKDKIKNGEIVGPEYISAGRIIDGKPPIQPGSDQADTPEKGREIVRRQVNDGADFIKVYSLLRKDVYLAIADESKKLGIPMLGHLPDGVSLNEGIKAGHKSLEHFIGVLEYNLKDRHHYHDVMEGKEKDTTLLGNNTYVKMLEYMVKNHDPKKVDSLIAMLRDSETWVSPSNVVNRAYSNQTDSAISQNKYLAYMPHYLQENWKREPYSDRMYDAMKAHYNLSLSIMGRMQDGGVKFLAATDYGNPYVYAGFDLHEELQIFVDVGFTPLEALQTATINPAKYLDRTAELGTVEIGKIANLVLLDKNPLEDIKNTRKIAYVLQRGKAFDNSTLQHTLDSIRNYNSLPTVYEELLTVVEKSGVDKALERYEEIKQNESGKYTFDKFQLNLVANALLKEKKYKDAITLYEFNNKEYPNYYYGYENLGEAYLEFGDTTKAIQIYTRAKELNIAEKPLRILENIMEN
ncbi:Amidohydrolase family protein [Muriicola jejuensis]|uniref:Amidohydrolase family protein n=1 Tax=Muriicola jejuensis TaxID=504488 RepID=A0A6P0UL32_9FLAO|nr:amidohydrolase family protein [Muriicola jejuensis]NER11763.1 amidohydrolase family protein [Muriicola jejuensis]SMP26298.1 Amidohydrolase family protein [Muriicola jejuensis]